MKKRSLDYDGLDGILQQPDASIQPQVAWYKSGWIYGLAGIVLASLFFLQNTPTQSVTSSNSSTEQSIRSISPTANPQKPTELANSALAKPDQTQASAEQVAIDHSVGLSKSNTEINAPVAQPAEIAAVTAQNTVEASTPDTKSAQTENQAPQSAAAISPVNPTSNTPPTAISSAEALFTVHFKLDSSRLNSLSSSESNELINAAKRCAKLIKLTGHTCNLGSDASNKTLGLTRAKAVKKLLLNNGVDSNRIITTSAGMTKPVASNDTPTGQALNRRTELSCQDD